MKIKTATKTIMAMGILTIFTACGGGGGGSSSGGGTYTPPSYVKPAKIQCGSKDCISGATASGFSAMGADVQPMSNWSDYHYNAFKMQYGAAKSAVANANSAIQQLNLMATDNSITSCEAIPTSGSFTFGGWNYTLGGHYDNFNIGNGVVSTDHSLKGSNPTGDKVFISFKCGTTQSIHIITKSHSGSLYETFYQVDTVTNAITILYGYTSAGIGSDVLKDYGYFKNDGADTFTFGHFGNTAQDLGSNAYVAGTKGYTSPTGMAVPATDYLEYAVSTVKNENIDTIASGGDSFRYRGCVSAYRTANAYTGSGSCSAAANPVSGNPNQVNFPTSGFPTNLIGNASAWSTSNVKNLTITDPDSINL